MVVTVFQISVFITVVAIAYIAAWLLDDFWYVGDEMDDIHIHIK